MTTPKYLYGIGALAIAVYIAILVGVGYVGYLIVVALKKYIAA